MAGLAGTFPGRAQGTREGVRKSLSVTTNTNTIIYSPATDERVRILRWALTFDGPVDLKFDEETTGDLLTARKFAAAGFWAGDEETFLETATLAKDIRLVTANIGAGVTVSGDVWYEVI